MQVFKVLNEEQLSKIRQIFEKLEWKDGKETARGGAKNIKNNLQAYPGDKNFSPITEILNNIFFKSLVSKYVYAKEIVGVRANSYGVGQTYGWHVDLSHMQTCRTDMSFTLFISDPADYDGGELQMTSLGMNINLKPQAGEIVIYPTGILHQVSEVTRGTRLAVVGWIESFVPNTEARDSLYKIFMVNELLTKHIKDGSELDAVHSELLNTSYHQLVRILTP